jgi:hypothetical protein
VLRLGLILIACAATAFVNPYGVRLPEAWLDIYRMKSLPRLIKEHSPIDLADRNAWMILLFGLLYLGMLAATLPGKPRIVWLLPLVWFALGCLRVRHAPLFAVAALIAIADLFPRTRIAASLEAKGSDLYEAPEAHPDPVPIREKLAAFAIPAAAVLLALVLQIARISVPIIGHGWAKLDPEVWPVELLAQLESHQNAHPGGTRIFNEYAYGGFLIYHTPGYRVFVDDRCELFGDEWLSDFIDAPSHDPVKHLEEWQQRYGPIDYALVSAQALPGFAIYFELHPAEWVLLERTETAALYKRK